MNNCEVATRFKCEQKNRSVPDKQIIILIEFY